MWAIEKDKAIEIVWGECGMREQVSMPTRAGLPEENEPGGSYRK